MFGVGSSQLGIGIAIKMHDQFSGPSRKVRNNMKATHKLAKTIGRDGYVAAASIGAGMTMAGVALGGGLVHAYKKFAKYEHLMLQVGFITNATTKEVKELNKASEQLASSTKYNPQQAAASALQLARAGLNPKEIIAVNKSASKLAQLVDIPLEKAAELSTDIMVAWGMPASAATTSMEKMALAANSANMDFTQMAHAMKYASSSSKLAGFSFEDTAATIGALANAGLKGSMGGVSLANFADRISKAVSRFQTSKQADALAGWGLAPADLQTADGKLKSLMQLMKIVGKKVREGATSPEFKALFGARGGRVSLALQDDDGAMGKKYDEIAANLKDASKYGGYLERGAAHMMSGSEGALTLLSSAVDNLVNKVGAGLAPMMNGVVKGLTLVVKAFTWLVDNPFGRFFLKGLAILSAVLVVAGSVLTIIGLIGLASSQWASGLMAVRRVMDKMLVITRTQDILDRRRQMRESGITGGIGRHGQSQYRGAGGRFTKGPGTRFRKTRSILDVLPMIMGGGGRKGSLFRALGRKSPIFKTLGFLGKALRPIGTMFSFLGRNLLKFAGPVGIIASIILMFVDFEDIMTGLMWVIKGLTYGIQKVANNIMAPFRTDEENAEADFQTRKAGGFTNYDSLAAEERGREINDTMSPWKRQARMFRTDELKHLEGLGDKRDMTQQVMYERMIAEMIEIKKHLAQGEAAMVNINVDGEKKLEEEVKTGMDTYIIDTY